MSLIPKVRQVLDKPDAVIFIGSGVSRWSELPSWPGLIGQLADFLESEGLSAELVRRELDGGELLQAASYGVDQLTKPQFGQFIRKTCRPATARPHQIHENLVKLGPTCFITTNYDTLVEDALRCWQSDRIYRTVTNRQLTETADIIQATASRFVFKPHGDVGDAESVILTREQYRTLHGNKRHILEAMKTLLVSRPVFFVGFGLRDPDFLYLKDVLASIFEGAERDHYAVISDVSDPESFYWRKNFGIHILSYATKNDGRDHGDILRLLDELGPTAELARVVDTNDSEKETLDLGSSEAVLAMIRYAARVSRIKPEAVESELPLNVEYERDQRNLYARTLEIRWCIGRELLERVLRPRRITSQSRRRKDLRVSSMCGITCRQNAASHCGRTK